MILTNVGKVSVVPAIYKSIQRWILVVVIYNEKKPDPTSNCNHKYEMLLFMVIWSQLSLLYGKRLSKRGNHHYTFWLAARLLYAHPTDRTTHTMVFVIGVVKYWLEQ